MRRTIQLLLVGTLAAGCSSVIKKRIKVAEVNTDHALLTGFMEEWSKSENAMPDSIPERALLDEAMLIRLDDQTCFDIVLRAVDQADRTLGDLQPQCFVDGEPQKTSISGASVSILEYDSAGQVAQTYESVEAASASPVVAQHVRTVKRSGTLCCPGRGFSTVGLRFGQPPSGIDAAADGQDESQAPDGELEESEAALEFVWIVLED
jgi:hypothetical protein